MLTNVFSVSYSEKYQLLIVHCSLFCANRTTQCPTDYFI